MKLLFFLSIMLLPVINQGQDVKIIKQGKDRVDVAIMEGTLSIIPLSENAVRIKFYKDAEVKIPELVLTSGIQPPGFKVNDLPSKLEVKIKNIVVELDKQTGKLSYKDNSGKIFLNEKAGTRKLIPGSVMGEPCFSAEQSFESPGDEYIFGLGQFQDGHYNLRNITRQLIQVNSQISIPFIYSNKGYGILWHQYGLTDFNPANNFIPLEKQGQSTSDSNLVAEVTTTSGTQKVSQHQSLYSGKMESIPYFSIWVIWTTGNMLLSMGNHILT
jgi:alpha-D-xyloside xylohydrolase